MLLCLPIHDSARRGPPGHWGNEHCEASGGSGLGSCISVSAGFVGFACSVAHLGLAAAVFPVAAFVCFVTLVAFFAAV